MKAATGFRLAQLDLTLDDLEWSKTKITVFDVKHVENGKSYDVGSNEHDFRSQQHGTFAKNLWPCCLFCFVIYRLHQNVSSEIYHMYHMLELHKFQVCWILL